jgi:diketogulonate reductase-like aldo/keto reductase
MRTNDAADNVTIADGVRMPLVGLGTWKATGHEAYDSVRTALDVGYRHIDTATFYGNEEAIGRAVRESGLARDDIFITTKLPPDNAGRERQTIESSLAALGVDRVDLWLVHWPPGGEARPSTWEEFIAARDDGLTRAIGVSNYSPAQIDELIESTGVTPAVNQIKWGPALYDAAIEHAHHQRSVTLEGWSPFRSTDLDHPTLVEIAARHHVTTRQVVLRWHIEHQVVVIPKSSDPARIAHNFDVFEFALTADEVARIDALGREG